MVSTPTADVQAISPCRCHQLSSPALMTASPSPVPLPHLDSVLKRFFPGLHFPYAHFAPAHVLFVHAHSPSKPRKRCIQSCSVEDSSSPSRRRPSIPRQTPPFLPCVPPCRRWLSAHTRAQAARLELLQSALPKYPPGLDSGRHWASSAAEGKSMSNQTYTV